MIIIKRRNNTRTTQQQQRNPFATPSNNPFIHVAVNVLETLHAPFPSWPPAHLTPSLSYSFFIFYSLSREGGTASLVGRNFCFSSIFKLSKSWVGEYATAATRLVVPSQRGGREGGGGVTRQEQGTPPRWTRYRPDQGWMLGGATQAFTCTVSAAQQEA